jgi:hypothetical protein
MIRDSWSLCDPNCMIMLPQWAPIQKPVLQDSVNLAVAVSLSIMIVVARATFALRLTDPSNLGFSQQVHK